ncbi:hypothetical protein Agabi119p4_9857 [Agaricus bisporus var. burnettii]|uniref:Uncharacterized protein n=1 Tax=Agaricus bisporus var. burnettii TaxID=192524 RepID=A0A8H7C4K0_AGABI|nr:hypothetical protein Agabi119p4_9857 [Agaricus bisporus var. burnettii]
MASYYTQTTQGPEYNERPAGKCWVINGVVHYSPNCQRYPTRPSANPSGILLAPRVSSVTDLEEPRWWKEDTEWMGFIPLRPVVYGGVWFEALGHIPRNLCKKNDGRYVLYSLVCSRWRDAEKILTEVIDILANKSELIFLRPFLPSVWKYHEPHSTPDQARLAITKGRDWFAVLLGLLFWMTRKFLEDPKFIEGLMPPSWLVKVLVVHTMHAAIDSIRLTPLLHRKWEIPRHGSSNKVYLSGTDGVTGRAIAALIVPIFGPPDNSSSEYHGNNNFHDYSENPSFDAFDNSHPHPASPPHPEPLQPPPTKRSAQSYWVPFFQKRLELQEKIRNRETSKEKQARLSRTVNPGITKARVYVWDWDDKFDFVREGPVAKRDNEETLMDYSGQQKRFDPYFNEWDCCHLWGPSTDNEGLIEILPVDKQDAIPSEYMNNPPRCPLSPCPEPIQDLPSSAFPPPEPVQDLRSSTEAPIQAPIQIQEQSEVESTVVRYLTFHHGFVPPTPLPETAVLKTVTESDVRSLLTILGLQHISAHHDFFSSPLGKVCVLFIKSFIAKPFRPDTDLWDLSPDNHKTLYFSTRLSSVRLVKHQDQVLYMFDFGQQSTVTWHLTVMTPASVFYVSRLPENMSEEEIAIDLVKNGIALRTLQRADTLSLAPAHLPIPSIIPMRLSDHGFTARDFEQYKEQCELCFSHPRSRAALMCGGFIARIASQYLSFGEAIKGPSGIYKDESHIFIAKDNGGVEYIDDNMTDDEFAVIIGMYIQYLGAKDLSTARKSWFPFRGFEGSGEDFGYWAPRNESEWNKRNFSILQAKGQPYNSKMWRSSLKPFGYIKKLIQCRKELYKRVIEDQVGTW